MRKFFRKIFYFFVFAIFLNPLISYADNLPPPVHALAMHGAPKYPADFKHFDYANPDAPQGGVLNRAIIGHFDNLNNLIIKGSAASYLELTQDKLMTRVWDEPFTLYGLVAETIQIPEDRSFIIFHLNPQARFHDGTPMTAEDVIFSYDSYRKYGHPVRQRVYGMVDKVTKLDENSVRFDFGEGYDAETALILAMMTVLPKHYWTAEGRDISKTTLTPPLGSGPYKIAAVDAGRSITYQKVPDYWGRDLPVNAGHYNFDTVAFSYYRDDDIAFEAFKSGAYNLRRENDIGKWTTGYDIPAVQEGRILARSIPHERPERVRSLVFNTRRDIFSDRKTRQALSLMFDFDWLNKNIFYGAFKRIDSFFPNSELAARGLPEGDELDALTDYQDSLPPELFTHIYTPDDGADRRSNMRKALKLLDEAGWHVVDQQLVRKEDGAPFRFEILLQTQEEKKIALAFAQSLQRLGITANLRQVESAQYQGRLDSFDYDMVFFTWFNTLSPGNEQVNYWGSAAADMNGSRNYSGVKNPAIDALAQSIAQAPSRAALVTQARALDRALLWGYYTIPLYYLGKDLVAHDVHLSSSPNVPTYGTVIETWWFDEKAN
ncbi:MAG: ABC transporter substrate-binding protein [Alphaproteobacteria bacterium]|nr:MAG: ABC transporter substrate-binding protein [Alphaproteobacteria bacterium]